MSVPPSGPNGLPVRADGSESTITSRHHNRTCRRARPSVTGVTVRIASSGTPASPGAVGQMHLRAAGAPCRLRQRVSERLWIPGRRGRVGSHASRYDPNRFVRVGIPAAGGSRPRWPGCGLNIRASVRSVRESTSTYPSNESLPSGSSCTSRAIREGGCVRAGGSQQGSIVVERLDPQSQGFEPDAEQVPRVARSAVEQDAEPSFRIGPPGGCRSLARRGPRPRPERRPGRAGTDTPPTSARYRASGREFTTWWNPGGTVVAAIADSSDQPKNPGSLPGSSVDGPSRVQDSCVNRPARRDGGRLQ